MIIKMDKLEEKLQFIRLTSPNLFSILPRYLFEQDKEMKIDLNRLYVFGPNYIGNPLTYLYAIAEKETHLIVGILWLEMNLLTEDLTLHLYSLDKKYQYTGEALKFITAQIKEVRDKMELTGKVIAITTRPKAVIKQGWQKSKQKIVEMIL